MFWQFAYQYITVYITGNAIKKIKYQTADHTFMRYDIKIINKNATEKDLIKSTFLLSICALLNRCN